MRKHGFTLIELIVATLVSGFLVLAIMFQFVCLIRFDPMVTNSLATDAWSTPIPTEKAVAPRESSIVIAHMARFLRFALPNTVTFDNSVNKLSATIEKGHGLNLGTGGADTTDIPCYYQRSTVTISNPTVLIGVPKPDIVSQNLYFDYSPNGNINGPYTEALLSSSVTYFCTDNTGNAIWDSTNGILTLRLKFEDGRVKVPVETKIKLLGGI